MAVHFSAPRDGWRRRGGKIDQGFRPESRAPAGTTSAGGQTSHDIGPAWLPYNSIPGTGTGSPATDKSGGFFWRLFGYMPETDENSGSWIRTRSTAYTANKHPDVPDRTQRTVAGRDIDVYTFGTTNLIVKMLENGRQRHTEIIGACLGLVVARREWSKGEETSLLK